MRLLVLFVVCSYLYSAEGGIAKLAEVNYIRVLCFDRHVIFNLSKYETKKSKLVKSFICLVTFLIQALIHKNISIGPVLFGPVGETLVHVLRVACGWKFWVGT